MKSDPKSKGKVSLSSLLKELEKEVTCSYN